MVSTVRILAIVLLFVAVGCDQADEQPHLDGTQWVFQRVEQSGQVFQSTSGEANLTFASVSACRPGLSCPLDPTRRISGLGPCNSFFGTYESDAEEGTLSVSDLTFTKKNCATAVAETENVFFNVLRNAEQYRLDGMDLRLDSADGAIYLTRRN